MFKRLEKLAKLEWQYQVAEDDLQMYLAMNVEALGQDDGMYEATLRALDQQQLALAELIKQYPCGVEPGLLKQGKWVQERGVA